VRIRKNARLVLYGQERTVHCGGNQGIHMCERTNRLLTYRYPRAHLRRWYSTSNQPTNFVDARIRLSDVSRIVFPTNQSQRVHNESAVQRLMLSLHVRHLTHWVRQCLTPKIGLRPYLAASPPSRVHKRWHSRWTIFCAEPVPSRPTKARDLDNLAVGITVLHGQLCPN
jgi:hypothetical protein